MMTVLDDAILSWRLVIANFKSMSNDEQEIEILIARPLDHHNLRGGGYYIAVKLNISGFCTLKRLKSPKCNLLDILCMQ